MPFNPVVNRNLQAIANEADWQKMNAYLNGLSNSAFRAASSILAEHVLPKLDNYNYWECFHSVALTNTKAYLMTFLKAAEEKYRNGSLAFDNTRFKDFAESTRTDAVSLDRQKTLKKILPILSTFNEVEDVLELFCEDNAEMKLKYLLQSDESKVCYYVIFRQLRRLEANHEAIALCLLKVMRRSTSMAFNFVSIMRDYFGIDKLNAQYSLRLQPYELSRLETSYDDFVKTLSKML